MFSIKPYFFHQTLVKRETGENQPYYLPAAATVYPHLFKNEYYRKLSTFLM